MKPHEENWTTASPLGVPNRPGEVWFNNKSAEWGVRFADEVRAKFVVQAPAMARLLLEFVANRAGCSQTPSYFCGECDICRSRRTLRDAGVTLP